MNKKQKRMLIRIILSLVLLIILGVISHVFKASKGMLFWFFLYLIPYGIIGYDILKKAFKGIVKGRVLDENFLMAVATVGAFALALIQRSGDYKEAVAVMLFYQIGELFQNIAVRKSRKNISELMDIRPDYANIEKDGELVQVSPDEVSVGSIITVQPGEKIPLDGFVKEGASTLNTAALTGESVPRDINVNDEGS